MSTEQTHLETLEAIGFKQAGSWNPDGDGIMLHLESMRSIRPALYAFVIDGNVMYVGKTKQTLGRRLYGYAKGTKSQRTNVRIRGKIRVALGTRKAVLIYAFEDTAGLTLDEFRIDLAAGLESSIIETLNPVWNIQ